MSERGTEQRVARDDVEVHHERTGCPIDGRRDKHFHSQRAWRAVVDAAGRELKRRR